MTAEPAQDRPNIVLILADDMGYSDLGCFGSEIRTPNLDRLAAEGLRLSGMYNFARCCPSRAALLTGVHPHQAGVGHMVTPIPDAPGYQGVLNDRCATVAEVLQQAGYRTHMSGKWHVGSGPGNPDLPPEMRRGFDRFFGIGRGSGYFDRFDMWSDATVFNDDSPDFYLTDKITDHAVEMIEEAAGSGQPFFQYVAYTAPHWPLHALEEDIERYRGRYDVGWDAIRAARHEELKASGLLDEKWPISARDEDVPPWNEASHRGWEAIRMAVYAAQIDRMDQGVGRILSKLREHGVEENTLVMFLSDNGGCAEFLRESGNEPDAFLKDPRTRDGRPVRVGNSPEIMPGPDDTFMSYDVHWANVSTTPFRLYKRWVHEGGISTPFIARWPARIKSSGIVHGPAQIIDITATCIDAAGAPYPSERNGVAITPLEGESLLPAFERHTWTRQKPMFWEHEGNRAVRLGEWKLVGEHDGPWELYNMEDDRTELNDLADRNRAKVDELARLHDEWAERCDVLPWPPSPGRWKFTGMNPDGSFRMRGKHGHVI